MATLAAQAFDRLTLPSSRAGSPANVFGSLGWLLPLPLAFLLVLPAWHTFHLLCDPDDAVPARVALFQHSGGSEPTDEYTPLAADNDALRQNDSPFWLAPPNAPDTPAPQPCKIDCRVLTHLVLRETEPTLLIMNLRSYPTWSVTLNGLSSPSRSGRQDGLITLPLPVGTDTVDIAYHRTPDQTIGLIISAFAILTAAALSRKKLSTLYSKSLHS
jgi:hypothetical protein